MNTVSITYTIKYVVSFARHYVWLDDFMYNTRTGRKIKQTMKGGSIGYVIDGKFRTLKYIKKHLVKPKKEHCPF